MKNYEAVVKLVENKDFGIIDFLKTKDFYLVLLMSSETQALRLHLLDGEANFLAEVAYLIGTENAVVTLKGDKDYGNIVKMMMEAEKPEVSYKLRNLVIIGDAYVTIAFNRDIVGTFTLRDGNKLNFEALSFADGTEVAIVTELRGRQVFSVDGDEWLM